jgi:hypothetical protein
MYSIIDYKYIDKDCREFIHILNNLPGIVTHSCCSGHGKSTYGICFLCTNFDSLNLILSSLKGKLKGKDFSWACVLSESYSGLFCTLDSVENNVYWLYKKEACEQAKIICSNLKKLILKEKKNEEKFISKKEFAKKSNL